MGDAATALELNETFAGFTLRELLGRGGMSDVYLAERTNAAGVRERFALKVVLPRFLDDPERRALFNREIRIAATLRHPNVVRVVEHGEVEDVPYLALEYVEGLDLRTLVTRLGADAQKHGPRYAGQDRGALPPPVVIWIGVGAARGLHAAHTQASDDGRLVGIVHRDVAPGNLFLDVRGVVRVADFGVSKPVHAETGAISTTAEARGRTFYMAPEQIDTKPDLRSDLFSLGVVLFELLAGSGRHPYEDRRYPHQDPIGLMTRASRGERSFTMAEALPGMPARLHALLEQLVHPDPTQRPHSAEIVANELVAILTEIGGQSTAEELSRGTLGLVFDPRDADDAESTTHVEGGGELRTRSGVQPSITSRENEPEPHLDDPTASDAKPSSPILFGPGMLIGHYRIVREIAKGGMGATYLAKREDVDMRVCLKTILPAYAAEPSYREMFLSEAKIAAKASHPNLASLIDYGEHESGALWLASEFVDGTDLTTLLKSSRDSALFPAHAAGIAIDVASGLLHLHTPDHRRPHAIVHRDISSNNVMVSYEGYAKLIDFGIAKTTTAEGTETAIKGKLRYMAPEMLRGELIGVPVDQWALGVMLYRAICARFPYKNAYDGSRPAPPSSPHGPLDPRWSSILERLLQPNPADRYPSLAAMLEELGPLAPRPGERLALGRGLRRKRPPPSAVGIAPPPEPDPEPTPAALRRDFGAMQPGERFGEWTIVNKIGAGGMAVVYKATRQRSLGGTQLAALKLIRPEHAASDDFVSRFRSEVEIAIRLNHQNIVHVLDAGEVERVYFIAMEYVEGCDLDTLLRALTRRGVLSERRLPPELAAFIGAGLLHALEYAHANGVVHRDVSPHNVLLTRDGGVKLTDFGVAKPMKADGMVSKTSHAVGKPHYMPTEQFRGDPLDGRADLFAAGACLFEMLAGASPYAMRGTPNETWHMVVKRVFENDRPHIAEVAPHAPSELITVIETLLQPNHGDRPANAEAVLEAITPLVQLKSQRIVGELVRAAKDEPAGPISKSVLEAVRVAFEAPRHLAIESSRPRADRTLPLPETADPSSPAEPTASVHRTASNSSVLLIAVALLALVLTGLSAFAVAVFWPTDNASGARKTPAVRPERPRGDVPPTAAEPHTPAEPAESNAPAAVTTTAPTNQAQPADGTASTNAEDRAGPTARSAAAEDAVPDTAPLPATNAAPTRPTTTPRRRERTTLPRPAERAPTPAPLPSSTRPRSGADSVADEGAFSL